jgi:hypothetical protein
MEPEAEAKLLLAKYVAWVGKALAFPGMMGSRTQE